MKKKIFVSIIVSIFLATGMAYARSLEHNKREVVQAPWKFEKNVTFNKDIEVLGAITGVVTNGTGDIFYVDSGSTHKSDTAGFGKSKDTPFATLDYAIGQCTANNGDIIYLMAGHTEQSSSYNQEIFDADVAGITIIGLGVGSDIPTFENGETTASCVVGAANVVISNIRIIPEAKDVAIGLEVEAAGDDVILDSLDFPEPSGSTAYEFTRMLTLASGSDRVTVQNSSFLSADDTGCNDAIDMDAGVNNGTKLINNYFYGQFAEAAVHSDKADLEVQLFGNDVTNLTSGQFAIEFTTTATGSYAFNTVYTDAEATSIDPGSMKATGPNWVTTAIDASPVMFPAQDDTAQNFIGVNDNDNAAVTSSVASNADGSILERLEFLQSEQSGSYILITSTVTSSSIPNNTQTGGAMTSASSGGLILEDVYISAGASGATGFTNLEISTDNVGGPTGAANPIVLEACANLDAAQQFSAIADGDTEKLPLYLETGKKIYIHGDDAGGSGAGTLTVNMVFRRVTDGATITGADIP